MQWGDQTELIPLQKWLERSGSVPLNIHIKEWLEDHSSGAAWESRRNLLDIVLPSADRCQALIIDEWRHYDGSELYMSIAQKLFEKGMPSLRMFGCPGTMQDYDLRNCPRLEAVSTYTWHFGMRFAENGLHLRRIDTGGLAHDLLFVLSSFPLLTECMFRFLDLSLNPVDNRWETDDRPVLYPSHLETLCVRYHYRSRQSSLQLLWNQISMPSLNTFAIQRRPPHVHHPDEDDVT